MQKHGIYGKSTSGEEERVALLLTLHVLDSNTNYLVRVFERIADEQPHRFCPFLVFDADLLHPEEIRKNTVLPLVPARRNTEGSWLGVSYVAFSGIYGAPAKPRALRFMVEEAFQHAWVVESDVLFTGNWVDFFLAHSIPFIDLLVPSLSYQNHNWPHGWHWPGCTLARSLPIDSALLPIFFWSKRFANATRNALLFHTGHHEAFLPTLARQAGFNLFTVNPELVGVIRWRPSIRLEELQPGFAKLYHPIKEHAEQEKASQRSTRR